jgi:hypothetical protein
MPVTVPNMPTCGIMHVPGHTSNSWLPTWSLILVQLAQPGRAAAAAFRQSLVACQQHCIRGKCKLAVLHRTMDYHSINLVPNAHFCHKRQLASLMHAGGAHRG